MTSSNRLDLMHSHPGSSADTSVFGPGRIRELDGLRGIAILLVIVHHAWRSESLTPLDRSVYDLSRFGWIGVEMFFVLSGFLITTILLETRGATAYFRVFYARRGLRIAPVYIVVLIFWFVIGPRLLDLYLDPGTADDAVWYWCYLSNFAMSHHPTWPPHGLAVTWSLAVEEQFYLIWPAVVAVLSAYRLTVLSIALVVAAVLWRSVALLTGHDYLTIYTGLLSHMDSLALGALIALLRRSARLKQLHRWTRPVTVGSIIGLVIIGCMERSLYEDTALMEIIGYSLVGLIGAALLVNTLVRVERRQSVPVLNARGIRALGRYSYCIYLIHVPVHELLDRMAGGAADRPILGSYAVASLIQVSALLCVLMLCGAVSWRFIEQPILGLKRHFAYGVVLSTASPAGAGYGRASAPRD